MLFVGWLVCLGRRWERSAGGAGANRTCIHVDGTVEESGTEASQSRSINSYQQVSIHWAVLGTESEILH